MLSFHEVQNNTKKLIRENSMENFSYTGTKLFLFLFSFWLCGGLYSNQAFAQIEKGYVLSASNGASRNVVRHFSRERNGRIKLVRSVSTRGLGNGSILFNQNGLIVDGSDVLIVNAGSNELSLLRFVRQNLRYITKVNVDGVGPVSVTKSGELVFVASAGDDSTPANISGYRLIANTLTPINGARAELSVSAAGPAQISFSPGGDSLIVAERISDKISVFAVDRISGQLGERNTFNSSGVGPFGFEFSRAGFLIVSESFGGLDGAVSSYSLSANRNLAVISPSVDAKNETDACWITITRDGKRAYTTNTNVGSISSYTIGASGKLRLLNDKASDNGGFPIDLDLTSDDRFLYTHNFSTDRIEAYSVNRRSGNLRLIQTRSIPGGSNGLWVR